MIVLVYYLLDRPTKTLEVNVSALDRRLSASPLGLRWVLVGENDPNKKPSGI